MRLQAARQWGSPAAVAARNSASVSAADKGQRFREVVVPHLGDALAFARWLTGSPDDAEDVVQEAAIRALAGIDTYAGGNARAWLIAIVRNTCFTWLAKHRPKSLVLAGDAATAAEMGETGSLDDAEPTPEARLIAKADEQALAQAIAALPNPFREVVILRDINGLSYREIASMTGVPIGTVMSRLARARGQLAAQLGRAT
jgi:RNA polymerase sigma factor (sigma-70 family)